MSANTSRNPSGRRRAPVMADVAKLAGVSHQTVSRVLNESEKVREDTRERVLEAMRALGYRPNSVARALVTGRSKTLGVVSFDSTLYGPAATLFAIERAAHEQDYFVSIVSLISLDMPSMLTAVERLRVQGVEGIFIIAPLVRATSALVHLPHDVPVVAVEAGPEDGVPVVMVDQVAGAAAATRHLLELGHRTVHHLAGPSEFLEAQQRVAGWRQALDSAGVQAAPTVIGDWSAQSGYEVAEQLVADPDVTAVFVGNDQMALGLLRRLHEHGRTPPDDVSIVGFDDIPESPYFSPPLTTVRQDFMEMGRRSVHLMLDEIGSGVRTTTHITVAPQLIVRGSTGPAPARTRR